MKKWKFSESLQKSVNFKNHFFLIFAKTLDEILNFEITKNVDLEIFFNFQIFEKNEKIKKKIRKWNFLKINEKLNRKINFPIVYWIFSAKFKFFKNFQKKKFGFDLQKSSIFIFPDDFF